MIYSAVGHELNVNESRKHACVCVCTYILKWMSLNRNTHETKLCID